MPDRSAPLAVALAALVIVACANRGGPEAKELPDGTWSIRCDGPLPPCLRQAEEICKNKPYDVLSARDQRERYGPEVGTAQTEVRSSEAIIRCGRFGGRGLLVDDREPPAAPPAAAGTGLLPDRAPAPTPARPAVPARACVPGSTQACIGPGKCEGGQSCLPDGSGFGPCDCGTLGPPPTTPAPSDPGTGTTPPTSITPGAPGAPLPPTVPGATPKPSPLRR